MADFVKDVMTFLRNWGSLDIAHEEVSFFERYANRCPKKEEHKEKGVTRRRELFRGSVGRDATKRSLEVWACLACGEVEIRHKGRTGPTEAVTLRVPKHVPLRHYLSLPKG